MNVGLETATFNFVSSASGQGLVADGWHFNQITVHWHPVTQPRFHQGQTIHSVPIRPCTTPGK